MDDRVALANSALARMRKALNAKLDVINLATFMHRISRLVGTGALTAARDRLEYMDVMQVGMRYCSMRYCSLRVVL